MKQLRLVQRRTVCCPTCLGFLCIVVLLVAPMAWWLVYGETFLSLTDRLPADVLVVEGWIGAKGVRAAAAEFRTRGYRYVVSSGSQPENDIGWQDPGWSDAQGAANELARCGIPADKIIVALARNTEQRRTYASAVAVWRKLRSLSIDTKSVNVFTWGSHARRSRLVFAKVFRPGVNVGVLSWIPSGDDGVPWWRSSERARELITETAAYAYEVLLNSNRGPSAPVEGVASRLGQHPKKNLLLVSP
jgi:hypothetical protein